MALLTKVEIKAALEVTDTASDTYFDSLAQEVDALVKVETRRALEKAAFTHVFDGKGLSYLRLREYPVDTAQTFTVHESSDQTWDASTLIDAGDYVVNAEKAMIHLLGGIRFGRLPQSIQVVYTAGLVAADAEFLHLRSIATRIAVRSWRRRKNEGLSGKSLPDGTMQFFPANDITQEDRRQLNLHRRTWRAG